MQYEFSVPDGQQVEVRLYFYDGYDGTSSVGDRVFDVSVEDQTVENFDIIEEYGDDTGAMKSFTVTSDGTIDVDFTHVTQNPQINAIEIVQAEAQPDELGASPSSVDFGTVVTGNSQTETVTLTNLGNASNSSHPDITVEDASIAGTDSGQFSQDFSGSVTLAPGESTTVDVTYSPSEAQAHAATMEVNHSGTNSPVTVNLTGEGSSDVPVGFSKSQLQGFSAGSPTAIDVGPDDRAYVSTQGGTVYALEVERTGEDSYQVVEETQIDAIKTIPNHDDVGNLDSDDNRQITGLTVGGTADQPVVYVSSSDPEIDVANDDDTTDTNSGAISRLTFDWNDDGSLASLDHDVMVLGLPRSEENHATNGLDLTDDGSTLYVAQGGHTNKGAPGDNFGHTPEYALSAAVLEIDLTQIEANYQAKSLQSHNSQYPDLDYYYAIPTVQGGDLPFGGNDGLNQAKIVPDGPVQVYSPGYRNPYDLVLSEDGQLYVIDNGPNGGWGGQPADSSGSIVESACTNHPNEDGSYGTGDQLHLATEGSYAGHATPIRANPDGAGLYDENGNQYFDFNESNTPVPFDMANPIECDYQDPSEDNSIGPTFGWTGGITEYTASNFGGGMQGDLLVVEAGSGTIKRVQLNATGEGVTDVSSPLSQSGALGITAQGDTEAFAGTVWTANHGGNDVTVFEPDDYDGSTGDTCTGDYDDSLDEDGDGYDNADEIDAGSDPCSAASTPPDYDDDGTSNLNDPDDDNDGIDDTEDLFAVDADNGLNNSLSATYDFEPNSHPNTILGLGFTGVMMNGSNYQDLYDPDEAIAGGAANVLTVETVGQGDAHQNTNTQAHGYQVGVTADEPFTVETTVNGLPSDAEPFQSQGMFVGTGDQDNYVKLTATGFSDGGGSGVQLATEESGSFTDVANPSAPTAGNTTTLSMTVYPSNGTVEAYYTMQGGDQQFVAETTVPTSWFDTADGNSTAVGVIATSNGASTTFDATWQNLYVEPLEEPANQPPTADAGTDQTVDEGTSVQLDATGSTDPDGDALNYSWTQTAGTSVSLSDANTAMPSFTAPEVDTDETLTLQVEVSDGNGGTDTDTVNVTVQDTDVATGQALHRVNAGGGELAALDDGPAWSADTASNPSAYLVDPNGSDTYNGGDEVTPTDTVPDSTPDAVFDAERYDQPDDGIPMEWEFPVEDGQQIEVRLYFGNQFSGTSEEGQREFNVSIEGEQVLTNYDPVADVGHANGTMKSFTVTSDGTVDVDFAHGTIQNPQVNAIEIVAVDESADTLTIEEAVASADETGNDTKIEFTEIQQAVNWWQTDAEVPNTGGQTIDFQKMQELINLWQTDATVGDGNTAPTIDSLSDQSVVEGESVDVPVTATDPDGDSLSLSMGQAPDFASLADNGDGTGTITIAPQDGDAVDSPYTVEVVADDGTTTSTESFQVTVTEPSATVGSAELLVTPNSGTEASTYGGGSFQLSNTGDENISTFTIDLSSTSMPDMVWDPEGTAGDQASLGLNIDSESGDGVGVVSTADDDVFSQPHNGVNGSDGYDVLTIEFTDFEPGETVTFSADNDPTSIKNATVSSQEAGPVSGLELARATVSTEYASGSTQETQLFGDGSAGGAQATLDDSVAAAPSIGVQNVSLDDGALRDHHSAATVSQADQTVTVTGQPGETVTLLHFEAELELDNVPEYNGTPGYDIEDYEANKIEQVNYQTVTLDSNGEAEVPVTLLNTTDVGGYNYLVATHGEPGADTGLDSNVVVLKLEESDTGDTGATSFATNAGGSSYTASDGTVFEADTAFTGGTTYSVSEPINDTEDDPLYQTERYGNFSYDVPLEDGEYEVTLHFAEIYQGVSDSDTVDSTGPSDGTQENDRLFNVSIEGQQVLSEYDIYAEVGPLNATQETFTAEVTDGELNIEFSTVYDNAKVSAIEIEPAAADDTNTAPTVDALGNQTVTEGDTAQVDVNASDPDGDALTLSVSGPSFVTLTDNGDGTGTLDLAPQEGDAGTYTVEVIADDGEATDTESFQLTVEEAAGDEVVAAINAGGNTYTASDGTAYAADSNFDQSAGTSSTSLAIGNTEDDPLYQTERYGDPLSYSIPVENGTYNVTLQFAEIWHTSETGGAGDDDGGGDGEVGDRLFNVSIEGQQVLTDYDIYAEVGGLNATDKTFTVEVTDGSLDITMPASVDNAKVSAITVENASGSGDTNTAPTIDSISDQTVTEGDTAQVNVTADDADSDSLTLSKTGGPDFVTLTDNGDGTGTLDIAPQSGDAGTYTVEVTADDGQTQATESFTLTVEEPTATGSGSADIAVTADSGIDASTYSGGSFEVTNTGDQQISSVQFDVSESLIPDAVFDPNGTAGDTTAKNLSIDSESGDGVSVVSTDSSDVFSEPHNGVDDDEGYDVMTIEFTDFEPGESVSFSIDLDPTTIKGASTTGGAGSISGLEIAGSQVNVTYADGSTQSPDLFGDGSAGGAQASATDSVSTAPTLGVEGVSLQSTDFPAHEAATVGGSSQNLTLSGPAGASVQLIHVEASEPPSDGYDLDAFEADNAQSVSYQTVTLDANGEATASVTLSESNLNYFIAAVDDGDTGQTSNTVILDYDSSAGELQTLHRVDAGNSTTTSAIDDGPDWTGVTDTSSPHLDSLTDANTGSGTFCGGDEVTPTDTVPSSTPEAVFDCELYGNMVWNFSVESGQQVEVRLYLSNQYSGASDPGDRQYNVSIEETQVLTQYDPVADVGHANGTMKNFTVTEDGDGTVTVTFEQGDAENPQVNAIEIIETEDSAQ